MIVATRKPSRNIVSAGSTTRLYGGTFDDPVRRSAPVDTAVAKPEVGAAALLQPDRWRERWPTLGIDGNIPTRLRLRHDEELDHKAASARTAHSHAPVFAVVTREDKISPGHTKRQAVALDDTQPQTWADPRPGVAPQPLDLRRDRHRAGTLSVGKPSSGSASPFAKMRFGAPVKTSSAKYSSSQAARLNCVRA